MGQATSQWLPYIKNYTPADYKLHQKNFAILQDKRGIMYIGNAYGILEFDGVTWNNLPLPNGVSGLSIDMDQQGKIFIGAASEIGYLETGSNGKPHYVSLNNKIPESERNFGEVWNTFSSGNYTAFISHTHIFIYDGDTIIVKKPSTNSNFNHFASKSNNKIFIKEKDTGLKIISGTAIQNGDINDFFKDHFLVEVLPYTNNSHLVITSGGTFILNDEEVVRMECDLGVLATRADIQDVYWVNSNTLAVATTHLGIVFFDRKGNKKQLISKKEGLPSNCVLNLFKDKTGNLWASTDNGISCIQINSPFRQINEVLGVEGSGYAAQVHKGRIYLGTSQGVYTRAYESEKPFELIPGTEGQVFTLKVFNDILLCGHTKGVFEINGTNASLISPHPYSGGWIFKQMSNKNYILTGTFEGLELYEFSNHHWRFKWQIKGFKESSRFVDIDSSNNIWVIHGNKGLYRLTLNETKDQFTHVKNYASTSYPPDFFNDLAVKEGKVLISTDKGFFQWNDQGDSLERSAYFDAFPFKDDFIDKMLWQNDGSLYLINWTGIVPLSNTSGGLKLESASFQKTNGQLIGSYQFVWKYDSANVFIGSMNGFFHYNPLMENESSHQFKTMIRRVDITMPKDSILTYSVNPDTAIRTTIAYNNNSLRFHFAALFYEDAQMNQYQFYLRPKGDKTENWSSWQQVSYKDYNNLREGDYEFHVRSKNVYGDMGEEAIFCFRILPPWYRSLMAYLAYFFLGILALYLLTRFVQYRIKKEKKIAQLEKKRELWEMEKKYLEEKLKSENEIMQLKNQQLKSEVEFKKAEMSALATNLSQKTEFLYQLKKELASIAKQIDAPQNGPILKLIKNIESGVEFDNHWEQFQVNFDAANDNFLCKLREKFPALKPADLLLCAYIRMCKSNKEIATLLNISVSAVEKRRYRLREKIQLDNDIGLTDFIMNL